MCKKNTTNCKPERLSQRAAGLTLDALAFAASTSAKIEELWPQNPGESYSKLLCCRTTAPATGILSVTTLTPPYADNRKGGKGHRAS